MPAPSIHRLAKRGDVAGARAWLSKADDAARSELNRADRHGMTPLGYAAADRGVAPELVEVLIESGADPGAPQAADDGARSIVSLALRTGDPRKVLALLFAGVELGYRREGGHDAFLDACHGRDLVRDPELLALLQLLIDEGVPLDGVNAHGDMGLKLLSACGRFDAVERILGAGVDPRPLQWTPLMRAAVLGSLQELRERLDEPHDLEQEDACDRTAWLLAVHAGSVEKARLLQEAGADTAARGGWGQPAMHFAIQARRLEMLRRLLEEGHSPEDGNAIDPSALRVAVGCNDLDCVDLLLQAGANVNRVEEDHQYGVLHDVLSGAMAKRLLDAGADPGHLSPDGQRYLVGGSGVDDDPLEDVDLEAFRRGRDPRFGRSNPERIQDPFWEAMIRAGVGSSHATAFFAGPRSEEAGPVWCAQRYGQSITPLPDGRHVQVGGVHEDPGEPDYRIYNDVFVRHPDGRVEISGYPEDVFPPTDFHTATRIGAALWIVGGLGYAGKRRPGETPVFRLDLETFRILRVDVGGDAPGWIHRHRADLMSPLEIRISGGLRGTGNGENEERLPGAYVLDVGTCRWRVEAPTIQTV